MKNLCLGFLLLVVSAPVGRCYDYPSPGVENRRKLSTLDVQMNVLTNELKRLKSDVAALKGRSGLAEPPPILLPLEVARQNLADGRAKFTLTYRAAAYIKPDVKAFWMSTETYMPLKEFVSNEIPTAPLNPDVYSTSVIVWASNNTRLSVSVGTTLLWYRLFIESSPNGSLTQKITSVPTLRILPAGDIVYEPFSNITVKITAPLSQKAPDPGTYIPDSIDVAYYINPIGTDLILLKNSDVSVLHDFYHLEEEKLFFDKREMTVVLKTSDTAYSGLLDFTGGQSYPGNMVNRIEKGLQKVLRPATQQGAFSVGFAAARPNAWTETDSDGNYIEHCDVHTECRVYCHFFGNNLRQIEMLRTVSGGETESITPLNRGINPYQAYAMETFRMEANQRIVNYTCVGSNDDGRRVLTTFLFHYRDLPKFIENQTSLELTPDRNLSLTCTAVGDPLPTLSLSFIAPGKEMTFTGDDLDVLYQTNDTISVSKVVPLSSLSESPTDIYRYYDMVQFEGTCEASNSGGINIQYLYYNPTPTD